MLNRLFRQPDDHHERAAAFQTNWLTSLNTTGPYGLWSGARVNQDTALAVPAFGSGVSYISNTIAAWDFDAYRGDEELDPAPPLLVRPNPIDTRFVTIGQIVRSLILRGDAFCLLGGWNPLGYPTVIHVLNPDLVNVWRDQAGNVRFNVAGKEVPASEILHMKANSLPGDLRGRGAIRGYAEALGEQIAASEFSAKFFKESAVPPLILTPKTPVKPDEAERFMRWWASEHGKGSRKPAFQNIPLDVQRLSVTPEEAQFLQGRIHGLTEIALMLNLEPHFLGAQGSKTTYANIQDHKELVRERALRPYSQIIEEAFTDLLPRGTCARFDLDSWMRSASMKERFETYAVGIAAGFMTAEWAAKEERLPVPPKPDPLAPPISAPAPASTPSQDEAV